MVTETTPRVIFGYDWRHEQAKGDINQTKILEKFRVSFAGSVIASMVVNGNLSLLDGDPNASLEQLRDSGYINSITGEPKRFLIDSVENTLRGIFEMKRLLNPQETYVIDNFKQLKKSNGERIEIQDIKQLMEDYYLSAEKKREELKASTQNKPRIAQVSNGHKRESKGGRKADEDSVLKAFKFRDKFGLKPKAIGERLSVSEDAVRGWFHRYDFDKQGKMIDKTAHVDNSNSQS